MLLISLDHSTGSVFFDKESCCWLLSLSHSSARSHSLIIWNIKGQRKRKVSPDEFLEQFRSVSAYKMPRIHTKSLCSGGSVFTDVLQSAMHFNKSLVAWALASSSLYRFSIGLTNYGKKRVSTEKVRDMIRLELRDERKSPSLGRWALNHKHFQFHHHLHHRANPRSAAGSLRFPPSRNHLQNSNMCEEAINM